MKISKATAYALHALMYMVRHITQLPATTNTIAKAEGIPAGYLAKIFQKLVKARLVRATRGHAKGYVFAKQPEEISLLELFEAVEGGHLFDDCLLRHCQCGGTPDNCYIYSQWLSTARRMSRILEETTLVTAAWNHPTHRFYNLPQFQESANEKSQKNRLNKKEYLG